MPLFPAHLASCLRFYFFPFFLSFFFMSFPCAFPLDCESVLWSPVSFEPWGALLYHSSRLVLGLRDFLQLMQLRIVAICFQFLFFFLLDFSFFYKKYWVFHQLFFSFLRVKMKFAFDRPVTAKIEFMQPFRLIAFTEVSQFQLWLFQISVFFVCITPFSFLKKEYIYDLQIHSFTHLLEIKRLTHEASGMKQK